MNIVRKYKISKLINKPLEGVEGECIFFMKNILDDLIPFKMDEYPNSIFYMNSEGKWIFEQDYKNDVFRVRYSIVWEVLETKYSMEYTDIQIFIKYMVEESFKQKVATPDWYYYTGITLVEESFKQKVATPYHYTFRNYFLVEESFKQKVATPQQ